MSDDVHIDLTDEANQDWMSHEQSWTPLHEMDDEERIERRETLYEKLWEVRQTPYSHQTIEYHFEALCNKASQSGFPTEIHEFGNWAYRYNEADGDYEDEILEKTWLTIVNHFEDDDTPSVPFTKLREPNIRLEEI